MNAADYEAQREELAAAILKRMTSSYIGAPPPALRGDAERAVWAVIHAGWQPPPSEALVEHMTDLFHGYRTERALCPDPFHTTDGQCGFHAVTRPQRVAEMRWILETAAQGVPPEGEE